MDKIEQIPLDALHPCEGNRRVGGFDKTKLQQLAESIRAVGVQQPAVVRPIVYPPGQTSELARKGVTHEIVAGERRWRAAKLAGLETLPCVVRQLDDVTVLKISTIENLQREDIHPLDEADGYARLIERAGYDVARLAAEIGKSASYVYQRLKLLDLVPKARRLLVDGTITSGHGILISRLQPPQQAECLKKLRPPWRGEGVISVRDLDDYIHRQILLDLSKASFRRDDADLLPNAGPCTTCPKRTGFQPALFADVCNGGKRDYCTDPACFNAKLDALVARRKKAPEAVGQMLVSTEYGHSGNGEKKLAAQGVKTRYEWEEARKGDPDAVQVLVVDGPDRGRVTWGKERKRTAYGGYKKSAKEKAAEASAREKQRIASIVRRRVWDAVMARASEELAKEIPEALLRRITAAYFDRLWDDARDTLVKAEGWERPERKPNQFGKPWRDMGSKKIAAMAAPELRLFLFKCSLAGELLERGDWYGVTQDPMKEVAKELGVDRESIAASVKAEEREKAAAKKTRARQRTSSRKLAAGPARKGKTGARRSA